MSGRVDSLPVIDAPSSAATDPHRGRKLLTLIRAARISSAGTWNIPLTPPLGLAYVAAAVRQQGYRVQCIDAMAEKPDQFLRDEGYLYQGLTEEEVLERIDPESTVIGLSCMFTQDWPYTKGLLRMIRAKFPHALLVAGGEHITALCEFSLRDCSELDVIVRGEGEATMAELMQVSDRPEAFRGVQGLAFLDRSGPAPVYVETPPRARLRDPDQLPWPAWDLLPVEVYASTDNAFGVHRGRSMAILATRGCPYKCTFCSNPQMYGNLWMPREAVKVADEIEHYVKQYGAENIDFYDLTMVLRREWVLEFCRELERRKLNITWQLPSGTRSEVIDDEVAAALYRTGCRNVTYAPESGSAETLKKIKKQVKIDRVIASIKAAIRQKIHVKCNIIIGFPDEDRRSIRQTLLLCWKLALLGIDAVEVMLFTPYPGTELFDELRKDGTIPEFSDGYFRSMAAFLDPFVPSKYCRNISGRELIFWRSLMMLSFFAILFTLRPWRLFSLIRSLFRDKSETVVENRLGALVRRPKPKVKPGFAFSTKSVL